jgi:hypothetical protein
MKGKRVAWLVGLALLAAALGLYLATLDNGLRPGELAGGDLITHQYAQVQGRPSNAPGYPLYTMGGWVWFHGLRTLLGPAANPTAILSSYSTLWALVALALLYGILFRVTGNWIVSLLASAFYAVTYFFWYYAASTEQYSSAVAHTLAIVLVAFLWEDALDRAGADPAARRAADRYLLILAFLCGLVLAHMVTVGFIIPPLAWFVLSREPQVLRRPRLMLQAAVLALLPLLAYAYVYARGAQHPEWRGAGQWPSTWAWFWDFVSTRQGREELTWSLWPLAAGGFPSLIWRELTWAVLLGGLAGLAALGRRRAIFLASTILIYGAFSFVDRQGNWYQVIMPAYALVVIGFGAGMQWLWQRLAGPRLRSHLGHGLLVAGLAALVLARGLGSWPEADQRDRPEDTALVPGAAILADDPAPAAAVLGTHDELLSLRYWTDIWDRRPDVSAVDSRTASVLLDSQARPVYATRNAIPIVVQEVDPDAHLSSAGATLVAVSKGPQTSPPPGMTSLEREIGDGLALAGYDIRPLTAAGENAWRVRLVWRATGPVKADWSVSARPTRAGKLIAQPEGGVVLTDQVHPVHGFYPTSRWVPGEVVVDDYAVVLPAGQVPDGLQVVLYRPADGGFENLGVLELPWPP